MAKQNFLALIFSICLLFSLFPLVSGYTDTSFVLTLRLSPDKVTVVEKTMFSLDSNEERAAFSSSLRLGRSTISDWSKYSKNIHYHVTGSLVYVNSTRIVAKRDFSLAYSPGVVVVEYEVSPTILTKTVKSSRATEYSINTSLLDLDRLQSKEIVLGNIDEIVFEMPEGDSFSVVEPETSEEGHNWISFKGPLTSKFYVSFIQEKTLSEEVNLFFVETYSNAANLVPLFLILALVLFVWFKLVSKS